jgi:hypothetical protein
MKNFLIILILISNSLFGQTVVYCDNMEHIGWTWKGTPKVFTNSSYIGGVSSAIDVPSLTQQYSSSDSCFRLTGFGTGSSAIEKDTLFYSNVTGLDPSTYYQIKFRLASFKLAGAAAAGVDGTDYVQLEYSTNGGTSFIKELKVVGSSNSYWDYSSLGQTNKNASGVLTTVTGSTAMPISTVTLQLPVGVTQLSFIIITVANADGECWMIDDVELDAVTCLPIELGYIDLIKTKTDFKLKWSTLSESNVDYFSILKYDGGQNYEVLGNVKAVGNSSMTNNYEYSDKIPEGKNYLILREYDFDGYLKDVGIFYIFGQTIKEEDWRKKYNFLGQEIK